MQGVDDTQSRRSVLQTATALSTVAIVGCSGSGSETDGGSNDGGSGDGDNTGGSSGGLPGQVVGESEKAKILSHSATKKSDGVQVSMTIENIGDASYSVGGFIIFIGLYDKNREVTGDKKEPADARVPLRGTDMVEAGATKQVSQTVGAEKFDSDTSPEDVTRYVIEI